MEPNTNPLGNPGPASGMPSGFPPSSNPPQGTSAPAGAVPAASTSVSQSQMPVMPQMYLWGRVILWELRLSLVRTVF